MQALYDDDFCVTYNYLSDNRKWVALVVFSKSRHVTDFDLVYHCEKTSIWVHLLSEKDTIKYITFGK